MRRRWFPYVVAAVCFGSLLAGAVGYTLGRRSIQYSSVNECILSEMKGRGSYMLAFTIKACQDRVATQNGPWEAFQSRAHELSDADVTHPNDWQPVDK
jgi:hypothetical protein